MSSSSIEVMGGEDMQMMLIRAEASTSQIEVDDNPSQFPDGEMMDNNHLYNEDMDDLGPPPGSIIFSPQDTASSIGSKPKNSKSRKKRNSHKGAALTVKMEEGIDYSKINLPVACEICGKIMANGRILVQHMTTHSVNKAFQCPHCPKSFTRMVHLQGHLVFHGIQKQFECPVCHQRFSRQDCVRVHMRLHDKSKCVYCSVCHKAFLTVGALNIHMRIHRGEKPFKCHLCGKCFTQKNHVITHIKRHTKISDTPFLKKLGPRMFQCEHCPRAFIRLSDYERHVQWNHGAVSDTNMISKTPVESLGITQDGSMDAGVSLEDLLVTNDITLNSKVRKKVSGSGIVFRRTMCSIGTQTDTDAGHVIIPRKYQNSASMTSEGTQMSAPPTPRHEEDMYENDIYDEGMDRNFSSDEDEMDSSENLKPDITLVSTSTQETGSSANDEAFDAVLGKAKPAGTEQLSEDISEDLECNNDASEGELKITTVDASSVSTTQSDSVESISNELGSKEVQSCKEVYNLKEIISAKEGTIAEDSRKFKVVSKNKGATRLQTSATEDIKPVLMRSPTKPSIFKSSINPVPMQKMTIQQQANDTVEHDPMIRVVKKNSLPHSFSRPIATKIFDIFNTKNWKGRGRGRGRSRNKGVIGLTGATHLRLIRKSMMNFITEKTEQMNESIRKGEALESRDVKSKISKTKRVSKSKPHDPDFVCNSKQCEMCNENIEKTPALEEVDEPVETTKDNPDKDQSAKLLQFLVTGDSQNLQGTNFRLLNSSRNSKPSDEDLEMAIDASLENNSVYIGNSQSEDVIRSLRERAEFFSASTVSSDDFASPPVELQSFCIPTYSCKLCGREFRFEGKLHRHIEAVHQKKEIFSPDVKPGRGSNRFAEQQVAFSTGIDLSQPETEAEIGISVKAVTTKQNPEIDALRSEWDDDDADNEMFNSDQKPVLHSVATYAERGISMKGHRQSSASGKKILPVIANNIVTVNNAYSDVYLGGVKLNINKLSGLAEFEQIGTPRPKVVSSQNVVIAEEPSINVIKENVPDTLDTKCQKLLQKLFDHTLLVDCGLYQEHVSVVLGKVLQHYGVKMIEDYGQGQYEVLKYNLWRLIEWKVTMEQMEEFYTDGKSVEEMMDDIMNGMVPIIAHHELLEEQPPTEQVQQVVEQVEAVQIAENQLVLSQVANVLNGRLNLGDGVTQVVLAQDVSPEMLQGAHIVTIDPATGQVLSQVTADQVILSDDLTQQIQTIDGQVVVTQSSGAISSLPPGSIVTTSITNTSQRDKL